MNTGNNWLIYYMFFLAFVYLSAGQCVAHSLQQRSDLIGIQQLLVSPWADCYAQQLLY